MATKPREQKDLVKIQAPEGVPDYLAQYLETDTSLDALKKERTLSRFKVIQGSASQELKKIFNEGDVIISPGQTLVANMIKQLQESERFRIVPIFFFVEYCKWADRNDTSSPTILARSNDKTSDIAKKAKDANLRDEEYGDGFIAHYVEHLNFACILYGEHPLAAQREPFILGFSRGEWTLGKSFITSLSRLSSPLWSTVWELHSAIRQRKGNTWWGIDFSVPEKDKFISKEDVEFFKNAHIELKTLFEQQRLAVDHSERPDDDGDGGSKENEF